MKTSTEKLSRQKLLQWAAGFIVCGSLVLSVIVVRAAAPVITHEHYIVTSTADPGSGCCTPSGIDDGCTLREAITAANNAAGADTIVFDAMAFGAPQKTVTLGGTQLPIITSNLTITGPTIRPLLIIDS